MYSKISSLGDSDAAEVSVRPTALYDEAVASLSAGLDGAGVLDLQRGAPVLFTALP